MNLLKHSLEGPTQEDHRTMTTYFQGYDYRGATYSFLANYIWRTTYCLCWEIIDGYLCMAGASCMLGDPAAVTSMPLTKDGTYDSARLRGVILEEKRRFDERKIPFAIVNVPGHMVPLLEEAFPGQLEITHDRDADEYVYEKEKLISLSGRALHKKKNHMNFFLRTYQYQVRPITLDQKEEIMAFVDRLLAERQDGPDEMESLRMEREAIFEALDLVDHSYVYAVAIYIDDKLQAFALGETLSSTLAVEHFEKANDQYRGLYQVICREFCSALPEEIQYVNREEDMGLEGLRQAKEALKPDHMEERFHVCFKGTASGY